MDRIVATDRPVAGTTYGRLHVPACVFLVVYGLAKLAELADWSRLHHDVMGMLGAGSGTVTGLLAAGKGAELLLTVLATLALVRRSEVLLLGALAGWTADLAVLAVVAAISADRGRLLEHGLAFVAFACLLTITYAYGHLRAGDLARSVLPRPRSTEPRPGPPPRDPGRPGETSPPRELGESRETEKSGETRGEPGKPREGREAGKPYEPREGREAGESRQPVPAAHPADETLREASPGDTRRDLPTSGGDRTRLDLPVRRPDVTRQDLPVRRPAPKSPPPGGRP